MRYSAKTATETATSAKTMPQKSLVNRRSTRSTITSFRPLILGTILSLHLCHILIYQTLALQCHCDQCGGRKTCNTTVDEQSRCFKSVIADKDENGTAVLVEDSGCFDGGNGSIAPMQCYMDFKAFEKPTYISCCNNSDLCNEKLSLPTDSRFRIPEEPLALTDYAPFIGLGCAVALVLAIVAYTFKKYAIPCFRMALDYESKQSNDSICNLKADIERFYQHQAGSSTSSRSFSTSYSMKKPDLSISDATCLTADLTSGVGPCILNQRTIAKAVARRNIELVGEGRFGRVFRGTYHGEHVAVKAFSTTDEDSWRREEKILRVIGNHPSIVRLLTSEVTTVSHGSCTEIWMILEYCSYGSLCDYLDHNEILGPEQAVKLLHCIIRGLSFLHEDFSQGTSSYKPPVAHRDIKSRNILMRSPTECCIADFGHAIIRFDGNQIDYGKHNHVQVGTVRYMAPEILSMGQLKMFDFSQFETFAMADVYQFGLVMWEICYRTAIDVLHPAGDHKLPYDDIVPHNPSIQDMIKIVCEDKARPQLYEKWMRYTTMKELSELMAECWKHKPEARLDALYVKLRIQKLLDYYINPSFF